MKILNFDSQISFSSTIFIASKGIAIENALRYVPEYAWRYDLDRQHIMMTSSNGNIFRVTGHLCGEFTGHRIHKGQWRGALIFSLMLSKQSWGWWFETPSGSLWRHYNASFLILTLIYIATWSCWATMILVVNTNTPYINDNVKTWTQWHSSSGIHCVRWHEPSEILHARNCTLNSY